MTKLQIIIELCISGSLVLIIAFGIIRCHKWERREFNNGYCPRCGERLKHIDSDSGGGRLYSCPKCGKYSVWISYHSVDKEFQKEEERRYYAEDGYGDRYGNKLED